MSDAAQRGSVDVPRIVGGSPTDDETAAIAAVFVQLAAERAAAVVVLEPDAEPSAWARSTRSVRAPWPAHPRWGTPLS